MGTAKRKAPPDIPLNADRIEQLAFDLIEREGLEIFSLRKLANLLGCQPMSLYHHYPSKAHLLDAMLDRLICSVPLPSSGVDWQDQLVTIARDFRSIALRHPRFFPFIATHRMNTHAGLGWLDAVLAVFRSAGLDEEKAAHLFRVFGYFLMGSGLDETVGYAAGPAAAEPVPQSAIIADYPFVAAAAKWFAPSQHERIFELGLSKLIASVEIEVENRGCPATK